MYLLGHYVGIKRHRVFCRQHNTFEDGLIIMTFKRIDHFHCLLFHKTFQICLFAPNLTKQTTHCHSDATEAVIRQRGYYRPNTDLLSLHNSNASTTDFLFNQHEPITQTLHSHSALSGYPGNTTNSSPTFPNMCSTSPHDRYALNLRCVHNHTLQLHNERERKIPHWGACHIGEYATLGSIPH